MHFYPNAKNFQGAFAAGGGGPFGEVAISTTSFNSINGSSTGFGGGAGYQIPLAQDGIVQLCPAASVWSYSGPNSYDVYGNGSVVLDMSETALSFGLTFGAQIFRSPKTQVIPFASIAVLNFNDKVHDRVSGATQSSSETMKQLDLGVGFILDQTVTLRPDVALPVAGSGGQATFGVTMGLNFGKSH